MYYAFIKDNQIFSSGECKILNEDVIIYEVTEDVYNNIQDYVWNGKDVVINPNLDELEIERKSLAVRAVREQYFADYVDWYQSKPLLWEGMTDKEKQDIADYRRYLMDYTKEEYWWEKNPMTFEDWKNDNLA